MPVTYLESLKSCVTAKSPKFLSLITTLTSKYVLWFCGLRKDLVDLNLQLKPFSSTSKKIITLYILKDVHINTRLQYNMLKVALKRLNLVQLLKESFRLIALQSFITANLNNKILSFFSLPTLAETNIRNWLYFQNNIFRITYLNIKLIPHDTRLKLHVQKTPRTSSECLLYVKIIFCVHEVSYYCIGHFMGAK